MVAANPKTVLVLIHGAPLSIDWSAAHVPAILDAHYPGQHGGTAIARTLFGEVSPAGRLTTTFYDNSINTRRNISDMGLRDLGGITYQHYTGTPLWNFGFGLSYTTFSFTVHTNTEGSNDERSGSSIPSITTTAAAVADHHPRHYSSQGREPSPAGPYTVVVTNTGRVVSDCVVLGFLSSNHTDAPANKELFDFDRVRHLAPGASATVYLTIPAQVLRLVDKRGIETVRPGRYAIEIGVEGAAEGEPTQAELIVTGETAHL